MRILLVLSVLALSGCETIKALPQPFDWQDTLRKGELRFEWPRGELHDNGPNYDYAIMPENQWRHKLVPQQRAKR